MDAKKEAVAVVLAAGKGTRMKTELPKVAVSLNGKPLLNHVIDHLRKGGVEDVVVVVGYKKEEVQALCKGVSGIRFAEQKEQLGTAHAVLSSEELVKDHTGPILVACGDVPMITGETFRSLVSTHIQNGFSATLLSAKVDNPTGYGRIVRNSSGEVIAIVEEKDADPEQKKINEINTGTYVFSSEGLFDSLRRIGNSNAQGEYYLPDLVELYKKEGKKLGAVILKNSGESQGVNSPDDLENLSAILNNEAVVK
ncbi:UDP-N-acetylglucosamine diphosphorylase [Leptospira wolffii]|uniref:UDP-N-acetylglucosamine diphosphorylase n=1 Tax=Leptospira wolffii TaxID=409998 RepID=A0A2M9Z960_9LEPT|nr:sugar phosphate nucleotidyltransferase [Leptospira wolffii]PJZ64968.1 UDP-N-acetylglucosamine diphosphorylase [Leptospira wolffii]TGK58125.1 UDP-N-acetylglucosamine diphosphorylase [Leptospira wolffii]TGK68804.1 UDP-N-acetylglucosamine diphosphorylase [Leptospira wolffii]TGK76356.1 UDP-N-acetylglucosamine diphosphorylase [Leptospira wolffii]TGL27156.1 UDP-N-acetylglucosamine diphosphorylase [Leptospira wolffii]